MATRMQQRRGTAAQWTSANPILAAGEIGFETDTGKFKMGNGSSAWSALSYFADSSDFDTAAIESTIDSKVATAVSDLVAGAPAALNTLNELALAIDSDSSFATTITNALSQKAGLTAFTNHESATTNVHGITDVAELATKSYADSAVTTHKNVTTNVHGIADTTDLVLTADLSGHNSDTTDVHGIPDTTLLATKSYADSAVGTHNSVTTSVHGISDTADLVYVTDLSSHADETTSVHGITNTADLVYTNDSRLSDTRTPTDGTVTTAKIADDAVTTAKILDSNVTTSKIADGSITSDKIENGTIVDTDISTTAAISQGKIDGLTDSLNDKAPLAGPTFTGTVTLPTTTSIGDVSSTELGYLDGVTSSIQTQIDSKLASATAASTYAPIASPTFTGTVTAPLSTAGYVKTDSSGVLSSSAAVAQADVTDLTSDLALKAPLASPALTGTPTAPTATAGTNTTQIATTEFVTGAVSDLIASAPGALNTLDELAAALGDDANFASTVTNSLALKAPLASPTFTGTVTVAASGIAFTDGTQTKEGVASRTPISQKTDSYTLSALTERDSLIEMGKATAQTVTIPTNATVAYPVGTSIDILQTGAGQVTIAGASGVTVNATPGLKLRTQWSSATLFKRATDTWVVMGDLTA
jgi:hypothetical protein